MWWISPRTKQHPCSISSVEEATAATHRHLLRSNLSRGFPDHRRTADFYTSVRLLGIKERWLLVDDKEITGSFWLFNWSNTPSHNPAVVQSLKQLWCIIQLVRREVAAKEWLKEGMRVMVQNDTCQCLTYFPAMFISSTHWCVDTLMSTEPSTTIPTQWISQEASGWLGELCALTHTLHSPRNGFTGSTQSALTASHAPKLLF